MSNVCYSDSKVRIITGEQLIDFKLRNALMRMAVVPSLVEYDEKIEQAAYTRSLKKYKKSIARAIAYFCAMVLSYFAYDCNSLSWALKKAESELQLV